MSFKLPELPYAYDALEPMIDAKTVEIHYTKHHAGYTNNLNNATENTQYADMSIEELLKNLPMDNAAIRNNAGGYYNHNLYWEVMNPENKGRLSGKLLDAINEAFGS
ncbi:MAG: superoxide dismutase, partial [Bacteroidetes bacterium]|nr:superoxide dismutase [Bacteroidota bacterium]